jgi:hypothetical protein
MAKLMLWISAFFYWFGEKTGLESKTYNVNGKPIGVNWPIVAFMGLIWLAMVVLSWIF